MIRPIAAILLSALLSTCSSHDEAQRDLNRSRRLWESQRIEDYRYTVRRSCFCDPRMVSPVVVEVRGGRVVSRTFEGTGEPVEARQRDLWPPVDGLFAVVQGAIDQNAAELEVSYHPELGYPTRIRIDLRRNVVDEEQELTASQLVRLP